MAQNYQDEITGINQRISLIDTKMDNLNDNFKNLKYDNVNISINFLRFLLTFLSILVTLLSIGGLGIGYMALKNIKELDDTKRGFEKEFREKQLKLDDNLKEWNNKISIVQERMNNQEGKSNRNVTDINNRLKNISTIFSKICINDSISILTNREKQLLLLLAKEIDSDSTVYYLYLAKMMLHLNLLKPALSTSEYILKMPNASPKEKAEADSIINTCKTFLNKEKKGINEDIKIDYGNIEPDSLDFKELQLNLIDHLFQNGFINQYQKNKILYKSKIK